MTYEVEIAVKEYDDHGDYVDHIVDDIFVRAFRDPDEAERFASHIAARERALVGDTQAGAELVAPCMPVLPAVDHFC